MTFKVENKVSNRGYVWVSLFCSLAIGSLTLVGCNKKSEQPEADEQVEEATQTTVVEQPVVLAQCSDVEINKLKRSIKESIRNRALNTMGNFADQAGTSLNLTAFNGAVESVLIDFSNIQEIQPANQNGLVTCDAKLSLTLPNKDVNRAKRVFDTVEGKGLAQRLQEQNITLNNNMLVSENFAYVTGMEGGQAVAKVVGEPAIVSVVSDIIATSQFEVAMAEQRSAQSQDRVVTPAPPVTPAPVQRPQTPEPVLNPAPKPAPTPKPTPKPEPTPKPAPAPKPQPAPPKTPSNQTSNQTPAVVAPTMSNDPADFVVPTDDSIEMVIIEEEGTY